jgi:hypothetical protein
VAVDSSSGTVKVGIGLNGDGGYTLSANLNVHIPGPERSDDSLRKPIRSALTPTQYAAMWTKNSKWPERQPNSQTLSTVDEICRGAGRQRDNMVALSDLPQRAAIWKRATSITLVIASPR